MALTSDSIDPFDDIVSWVESKPEDPDKEETAEETFKRLKQSDIRFFCDNYAGNPAPGRLYEEQC